jgi:uncharacterized protein YndB with AHSA1/START domain
MATEKVVGAVVRARVAAPPERLWQIVAEPARHPELAGSGEPRETWLVGEGPLTVGSRFESRQKWLGMTYTSHSEVTACQEPRLLRWRVDNQTDWEFRLEQLEGADQGSSEVIHSYRWSTRMPAPLGTLVGPLLGWRHGQIVRGMVGTFDNLARLAGAPHPTGLQVSQQPPSME